MTTPDKKTLATLTKLFEEEFGPIGDRQVLYVHAPGRSEISGNHTDHEGGHVIAGSLDVAVDGIAVATDSNKVRVADEGYPTFEIALDTLDVQESEKGTSASLVRGMAHEIAALGVEPQGFDFAFTCSVPSGGGLSSSAAVEDTFDAIFKSHDFTIHCVVYPVNSCNSVTNPDYISYFTDASCHVEIFYFFFQNGNYFF